MPRREQGTASVPLEVGGDDLASRRESGNQLAALQSVNWDMTGLRCGFGARHDASLHLAPTPVKRG
jgi:hypothetical protein